MRRTILWNEYSVKDNSANFETTHINVTVRIGCFRFLPDSRNITFIWGTYQIHTTGTHHLQDVMTRKWAHGAEEISLLLLYVWVRVEKAGSAVHSQRAKMKISRLNMNASLTDQINNSSGSIGPNKRIEKHRSTHIGKCHIQTHKRKSSLTKTNKRTMELENAGP